MCFYLVVEHDGAVHVRVLLLVVAGGLHHVLGVAEQRQVQQLLVQVVLLAEADGVVVRLGPRVEVHRLADVLLALVLPRQVVGGRPVARLVGDLARL